MQNSKITGSQDVTTTIIINKFQAVDNPKVYDTLSIGKILSIIKNGDTNLPIIQKARLNGKGSEEYDKIKAHYLPSFRFNFLFNGYANNSNIIASTGLIYIDVDNVDTIPENDYIFAKWKSLSGLGYGILVRVEGMALDNYKDTYNELATIIGIEADEGGRKATQQTVLSYDPNLFFNENSRVYMCAKVSPPTINKKSKGIITSDTTSEEGNIRFNNIEDFFTNDMPFLIFKEKQCICKPYIPRVISQGQRNGTMFFILSQFAVLNPSKERFLHGLAELINKHMHPRLPKAEVNQILRNILSARKDNSLSMHCTHERKVLFNPRYRISFSQKMEIVNKHLGFEKSQKSRELIYQALENWDFNVDGKITQKKIALKTGLGIATVKRHWRTIHM